MKNVATLLARGPYYICSNCRVRQHVIEPLCWWCESLFTNYEEIALKQFNEPI